MPQSTIIKMGNKKLLTLSMPIESPMKINSETKLLIGDLIDTMKAENGVGIAAPQIGINKRIIIFGFTENKRYPNKPPIPLTVLINPEVRILSNELVYGWEGCLSVPGLRGLVPRYSQIEYSGFDEKGQFVKRIVDEFHARVVQHEYDHLNGILYPQRMEDMTYFGYEDELIA
ncbi:MAG: peptide deformylase [Proteobacteria bacterium]|nr:peptide deformylase [Pseudomonadota bacterium]